jgi:hypothetical protein
MPETKDAMDLFERIQTVLFYMTTDSFITETQACRLLWPLLEGSEALDTVLRVRGIHGPDLLAARCSEGVRTRQGVMAQHED